MAPRITSQISDPGSRREYVVARHIETQELVSVAQWSTPSKDSEAENQGLNETAEEKEDREHFEDEMYRSQLPSSSNKNLIMDFRRGVRDMRARVLGDRRHYGKPPLPVYSRRHIYLFPLKSALACLMQMPEFIPFS
jgi:hypothetical protein